MTYNLAIKGVRRKGTQSSERIKPELSKLTRTDVQGKSLAHKLLPLV